MRGAVGEAPPVEVDRQHVGLGDAQGRPDRLGTSASTRNQGRYRRRPGRYRRIRAEADGSGRCSASVPWWATARQRGYGFSSYIARTACGDVVADRGQKRQGICDRALLGRRHDLLADQRQETGALQVVSGTAASRSAPGR